MFKPKHQPPPDDSAERGISTARVKELLAEVDAEPPPEVLPQDAYVWRGSTGRRRVTKAEAEVIKRRIIGPWRRHFTLSERMEFLTEYEVIADEPMPIPTSTTHHAEVLAQRAARAAALAPPPKPKANRFVAAAKVLFGVDEVAVEAAAEPVPTTKHRTFFG